MATTATLGRVTAMSHHQLRRRALAVTASALAALAALAGWSVAVPLLGVDLTVRTTPSSSVETIGAGFVVAVSLLVSCWAGDCSPYSSTAPSEPGPYGPPPPVSCCCCRSPARSPPRTPPAARSRSWRCT